MNESNFCCGKIPNRKQIEEKSLPENPNLPSGIQVIYLGAGNLKIDGNASGLIYYFSDHRRRVTVHKDDAETILKRKDFIAKP